MAERGYGRELHDKAPAGRGCSCKRDFEHDGKCQNALRETKSILCIPCSTNWHYPYPCRGYQPKGYPTLTTQCGECGWDSAEHPYSDEAIRQTRDSRVARDSEGRYPGGD